MKRVAEDFALVIIFMVGMFVGIQCHEAVDAHFVTKDVATTEWYINYQKSVTASDATHPDFVSFDIGAYEKFEAAAVAASKDTRRSFWWKASHWNIDRKKIRQE
jgi:hypothetical protein